MDLMEFDFEAYLDQELTSAPRELSKDLYHYTSSDAAILGILSSGKLRLSPFDSTNDLWESRPLYPNVQSHADDLEVGSELWEEIDRSMRLHAKVTCLTQDWKLHDSPGSPEAFRGWAHLSLWAHYGGGHSGVCLRFDRDKLIDAFLAAGADTALYRFHGPVVYRTATLGAGPYGIDFGQVREFGVDAVAAAYAEAHKENLFFRKHRDWENESEYRLVLLDQSILPAYFDIRNALTGVFLGDAFPPSRMPALLAVLEDYPDAEIFQLRFHNRVMNCFPYMSAATEEGAAEVSWKVPARSGSLIERLDALRAAEKSARALRDAAAVVCREPLRLVQAGIQDIVTKAQAWPASQVVLHSRGPAIPEADAARAPGVPGEQVHWEDGFSCIVENLPAYSNTLVAAMAIQALPGDQLRAHAVISTERYTKEGNERREHWRRRLTAPIPDSPAMISGMLQDLSTALEAAKIEFDKSRGL